jgi:hypothetical protein
MGERIVRRVSMEGSLRRKERKEIEENKEG